MKNLKFGFLLFIFALPTVISMAVAGAVVGSITSVSSDCETVTISYTVNSNVGPQDLGLSITGYVGLLDISDAVNSYTVTVPISPQANGTTITVNIEYPVWVVATKSITCSTTQMLIPLVDDNFINDGRVEPFWADHVIYPANDGIFIYSDEDNIALFISVDTIEMIGVPDDDPRLLGETIDAYLRVYRLSDGRYQVLVGPDYEGKTHIVIWEGLGYVHNVKTSTLP